VEVIIHLISLRGDGKITLEDGANITGVVFGQVIEPFLFEMEHFQVFLGLTDHSDIYLAKTAHVSYFLWLAAPSS